MDTFCTVTTTRAPFKQTLQFAHYHLSVGAERVILFFDDPSDPAADALSNAEQITVVRCDNTYWNRSSVQPGRSIEARQVYNATLGYELACRLGYDWIFHIDVDELIFSQDNLRKVLSDVPPWQLAVKFRPMEAVPDRHDYESPFEVNTFRVKRFYQDIIRTLGLESVFFGGKYLRAHYRGKSATRSQAKVQRFDIHRPVLKNESMLDVLVMKVNTLKKRACILHFDCCGLDVFRQKWRRRIEGKAVVPRMSRKRKMQREEVKRHIGDEEEMRKLYERLYFISDRNRSILYNLGLLARIQPDVPKIV